LWGQGLKSALLRNANLSRTDLFSVGPGPDKCGHLVNCFADGVRSRILTFLVFLNPQAELGFNQAAQRILYLVVSRYGRFAAAHRVDIDVMVGASPIEETTLMD